MKKNLLLMLAFMICTMTMTAQQNKEVTMSDYERYIDAHLEMQFRNEVIKKIGLTSNEIIKFDPWYREYMNDKSELVDEKMDMVEEYQEEMEEDDSASEEEEDTADFIEDYWELEIDGMELKREAFDDLEEIIPLQKAVNFFLYEEAAQRQVENSFLGEGRSFYLIFDNAKSYKQDKKNQMKKERKERAATKRKRMYTRYQNNINTYSTWVKQGNGKVDLSHDYTHDGLDALAKAIVATANLSEVNVSFKRTRKNEIMRLADKLKVNKWSDEHADIAKEAFNKVVYMLEAITIDQKYSSAKPAVQDLRSTVDNINKNQLLTKQKDTVYNFFAKADKAIQMISKQSTWR